MGEGELRLHRALDVDQDRNTVILLSKPEAKIFTFDQVGDIDINQVCNVYSQWLIRGVCVCVNRVASHPHSFPNIVTFWI